MKRLEKDKIYKAMAATNKYWKFNFPFGFRFGGIWALDLDCDTHSIDHSMLQKNVARFVQDNSGQDRSYIELQTTKNCG